MKINSRVLLAFLEPLFIFQSRNPIIPIQECVELVSEGNTLTATVVGLAGGIRNSLVGVSGTELPLQVEIPIDTLHRTLKMISDEEISLEQDGNNLVISSPTARYQIGGEAYEPRKFPTISDGKEVEASELAEAITRVLPICSTDELRPALTGVFFDTSDKKGAVSVATDGHQIGWYQSSLHFDQPFLIKRESAHLLAQTLEGVSTVKVSMDENKIYFLTEGGSFYGILIREQYPAWRNVLPVQEKPITCTLRASTILGALKRLSLYAVNTTLAIRFQFNGQTLEMKGKNDDYGREASESLNLEHDGEDITIAFNGIKLRELISLLQLNDDEQVIIKMDKPNRGAYVQAAEGTRYKTLLMPLHLENVA